MILTEQTYSLYAAKHYDNRGCLSEEEFLNDLRLIPTLNRLIHRYRSGKDVDVKAIVNVLVTINNCFPSPHCISMLKIKSLEQNISYINSILLFLSLPTINSDIDEILYQKITKEYS